MARVKTRLIATDMTHFGEKSDNYRRHETGEYIITTASIPLPELSEEAKNKMAHFYNILKNSKEIDPAQLEEIASFQKKYKEVPQMWNLLNAAYQAAGEHAKAEKLVQETFKKFPHYFFAKINMVFHWLYHDEMKKAAALLEGKRTVKEFEPTQDEFHISAVENFHYAMVLYAIEKEDIALAREHRRSLRLLLSAVGYSENSILDAIDGYIEEAEALLQEEELKK